MNQELHAKINKYLNEGFSKSELARQLEISRSTLMSLLKNPHLPLSHSTLGKIQHNLDWLDKSHGHELMEFLILFMLQRQNLRLYLRQLITTGESLTGYKAGYHGMTYGGPSGFLLLQSPGVVPIAELAGEAERLLPEGTRGRTETYTIATDYCRYSGNHDEAREFYKKNPDSRVFLKFFTNHTFTVKKDISNLITALTDPSMKDDAFLLESGMITGPYDFFILLMTKDEATYTDIQIKPNGVYSISSSDTSINESKTFIITDKKTPCFEPDDYGLSFGL